MCTRGQGCLHAAAREGVVLLPFVAATRQLAQAQMHPHQVKGRLTSHSYGGCGGGGGGKGRGGEGGLGGGGGAHGGGGDGVGVRGRQRQHGDEVLE